MKTAKGEDARRTDDTVPEQKHYGHKAGWLAVGEWCARRVALADLGRKLSIGRRRAEKEVG